MKRDWRDTRRRCDAMRCDRFVPAMPGVAMRRDVTGQNNPTMRDDVVLEDAPAMRCDAMQRMEPMTSAPTEHISIHIVMHYVHVYIYIYMYTFSNIYIYIYIYWSIRIHI